MIAHLVDLLTVTRRDGGKVQRLTLDLSGDFTEAYDQLKDSIVNVDIKKYRERRSLDANAYCWVLIDKIAEKAQVSKVDVYQQAIRNIGGVSEVVCVKNDAVPRLTEVWCAHGIGWQVDTMPSKLPGCTNVMLYYGSSEYDTEQMSRLIDQLVQDAQALGIPTDPQERLDELKSDWGRR